MDAPRGYANDNRHLRRLKAGKIEHLLGGVEGLDLLDLGAGSGLLSEYFASKGANVTAADRDPDKFLAALPFVTIGDRLPFAPESFDVVVFNHVIEHVGDRPQQSAMLEQIATILRPGGRLYLAAPTKWALIEPHFRIPLLGAMPRRLADWVVRLSGKGKWYDCYPLPRADLHTMIAQRFARVEDVSTAAFKWMCRHENPTLRMVPPIPALFPTAIFIASKGPAGDPR